MSTSTPDAGKPDTSTVHWHFAYTTRRSDNIAREELLLASSTARRRVVFLILPSMAIAGVAVALLTRAFTPSWMADEIYLLIVALAAWVFGELAVRALFHLFARWRARGQMIGETVAVTIKDDALVVHRDGQALEIDWRKITAVLQCSGAIFLCRYEAEPIQIPRRAFAHAQVSRDIVGWVEKRADIEEWGL